EGGWSMRGDPARELFFTAPNGRVISSKPVPGHLGTMGRVLAATGLGAGPGLVAGAGLGGPSG
ncbi:MAG: hypothetical protein ACYDH5_17785, partial [Acidimicrobiales bacterium]